MEVEQELKKAKLTVERALKIRLRSLKEIEDKLSRKGFSPSIIQETLSYFIKVRLVDDALFTKAWIQSRLIKPFAAERIRSELILKGIDSEIIRSEMDKVIDQFENDEMIKNLINKMKIRYKNVTLNKRHQRAYGYLSRRGFENSTIMKVIKQL